MTKLTPILALALLTGCATPKYIDAVTPNQTRRIGSEEIASLPAQITLAQLFKRWGPAAAGKELIYVYRSKIEGISLLVFVEFPDGIVDESHIGSAEVAKMIFTSSENEFPKTVWQHQTQ